MLRFAPAPAIAGLNGKGGGMGVRRRVAELSFSVGQ
jgi:hypothetical protein